MVTAMSMLLLLVSMVLVMVMSVMSMLSVVSMVLVMVMLVLGSVSLAVQSAQLANQGVLEDDLSLLVSLRRLDGKLVHPAELSVTSLAHDVPDHVPARQHLPLLHPAHLDVDDPVEETRFARGSGEATAHQVLPVRQVRPTLTAAERPLPAQVLQEGTAHFGAIDGRAYKRGDQGV